MSKSVSFTRQNGGIASSLRTEAVVFTDCKEHGKEYEPKIWTAVWDTGSSNTVISERIVFDIGLTPVGEVSARVMGESRLSNVYIVSIGLPNGLKVPDLQVIGGDFSEDDFDILIGMDIITLGDFAVTNANGKTVFSFRYPPKGHIDFTEG